MGDVKRPKIMKALIKAALVKDRAIKKKPE